MIWQLAAMRGTTPPPGIADASGSHYARQRYSERATQPAGREMGIPEAMMLTMIVQYIMISMEPTDRALRPYGDICTPEKMHGRASTPGELERTENTWKIRHTAEGALSASLATTPDPS